MSSLSSQRSSKSPITYISFNQDFSCLALGCEDGLRVYNIEGHRVCYRHLLGAVSIVEMLYCTSLMAFVGAGEQPSLTPRKLTLINTATGKTIQDINCTSSVLAVKMNRTRIVIMLERRTFIHALDSLQLLRTLEHPPASKGVLALTSCSDPNLLALPASNTSGTLRVYDLTTEGGSVRCEINAHKTPLGLLAWNHDGTLLATASTKGTVVRVHRMPLSRATGGPAATRVYTFRRGSYPATIHCLGFSPAGVEPPLLCATSSHGSVHIFRLEEAERHPAMKAATAAAGLLSAVVHYSVTDMMEPQRSIASIRLPCQNVASLCTIYTDSAGRPPDENAPPRSPPDQVLLVVATAEGLLYQYTIEDLRNPQGPRCSLEGEWLLLGSSSKSRQLPVPAMAAVDT